jgi:putative methionine-R-sulfoxide reductase with GAF domain
VSDEVVQRLAAVLDTTEMRELRARHAAETVRAARNYRWVGIYDVGDEEIELIGHTGAQAPAFVRFSVEQGLSGDAVRTREIVTSASEAVVPILGAETGMVIGTLDVESDKRAAFGDDDRRFLEACAQALMPLFE